MNSKDNNANNSVNCGKSANEFVDYTKFCIPIIHSNLLERKSFDHDSYSTVTAKTLLSYDMLRSLPLLSAEMLSLV